MLKTKTGTTVYQNKQDFFVKSYWGELKISKEYAVDLLRNDFTSYQILDEFPDLLMWVKLKLK